MPLAVPRMIAPLVVVSSLLASLFIATTPSAQSVRAAEPEKFDVVLKGGRVVDGTGAPWYVADVGVRNGRIAKIGRIESGERTIDAKGLIVAPGFIDMMGQNASVFLENPAAARNLLAQGITTINCGEGVSAAPPTDDAAKRLNYRTMAEYFQLLDMRGMPVNVVQTVGHTQCRLVVLGEVDRRPSPEELSRMQQLVREAMEAGAIGVSTSLIYPPAVFADTAEIAALTKVAGEYGGRYFTHMRNEGDKLLEAIDEALEIGRESGTPVHIFHLKAAGRQNWPKMEQAIARIKAARDAGQQVTADIYPYINNGLGIAAFIHPRHFTRGEADLRGRIDDAELRKQIRKEMETESGWENWYRHIGQDWSKVNVGGIGDARYSGLSGKSLAEIARAKEEDPWDTFFNLVKAGAFALPESMSDENVVKAMQQDFVSFCTDVGPASGSRIASHPRAFGALPRVFARYVREKGALSLERAVSKASAVAANDVLALDRGRIAVGLAADLIAFEPQAFADQATFAEPQKQAVGMRYVLVNGEVVWDEGTQSKRLPGRVLRGPGYKRQPVEGANKVGAVDEAASKLNAMLDGFMEQHRVPGCSVAVAREGKLVYARGFGWSDVATREPVTTESLFRIASISKPITAVALLKLVEAGKLKLDDRVFDLLKVEPPAGRESEVEPRLAEITLRQLLQHRGGWDREKSFDAMFRPVDFARMIESPPPAGPLDVMRCMMVTKLDFPPGERFAYSNYGYCLLGRVIEKATGKSYEQFVRDEVLAPAGVTAMRIGRTRLEGRAPREVRYYDPAIGSSVFAADLGAPTPQPYGAWHLEAMDSHGGWLASAIDLVKFASTLDRESPRRLLKPETLKAMLAPPTEQPEKDEAGRPRPTYYALGWNVRTFPNTQKVTYWHTGSLPGTATILIRRFDGLDIAVLFNSRVSPGVDHLTRALERPLHETLDAIKSWPPGTPLVQ